MNSSGEGRTSSNPQRVQLPSIRNLVDALPPASAYRSQHLEHSPAFTGYQKQEKESPLPVPAEQVRPSGSKSFNASSSSLPPASADRSSSRYTGVQASSSEQVFIPQMRIRKRALSNHSAYEYRDNANADGVASSQTRGRWLTSDPHSAAGESTSGGLSSGEPTLGFSARDHGERRETGQGAQIWSATPPPSRDYRTDLGVYRRDESTARDPFHPRIAIDQTTQTAQTTLTVPTPQTPHGHPPPHLPSQPWNPSSHSSGLVPGKHHDFVSDRPASSTSTVHISHGSHLSQPPQTSQLPQLSRLSERERVSEAIINPIDDQRLRLSESQSQTHQSHQSQSYQSHYHRSVSGPGPGQDYLTPPWSQPDRHSSPRTSTVLPSRQDSRERRGSYQGRDVRESRERFQGREDHQTLRDNQESSGSMRSSSEYTGYPKYSKYSEESDRDRYNPERERHVTPSGTQTPSTPKRLSEPATYEFRASRNAYNQSMSYNSPSPHTPHHPRSDRSERSRERDYAGQSGQSGHAGRAYGRRDSGTGTGNGVPQRTEIGGFTTSMPPPRIPSQPVPYGERTNNSNRAAKSIGELPTILERRGSAPIGTIGPLGVIGTNSASGMGGRNSSESPNNGPSGHAYKYGTDYYNYNSSSEQWRQPHQQFAEPPVVSARSQRKRRTDGSADSDVVNAAGGLAMLAAGVGARAPAQSTHPGYSVQPGQSALTMHPAHLSHSTHSTHPTHSALSPYPQHSTHPSQSAQSAHPSDAIHPALAGLLRQRSKEDLPRVLSELSEEAQRAVAEGRVMKTINEYSRTIARFAEFFVRAKGSVVATPEQVKEMSHRAVLICRMARDLKAKILAKRRTTEEPKQSAVVPAAPVIRPAPAKRMTKQQIKDMKKIRKKRDSAQQGIKGKYTKRNKKTPAPKKCSSCGIKETPEWRKGPEGPRTLCNACGLHYAKLMKNRETNEGKWIGSGSQPTIDIVTLRQATGVGIQPQLNERGEVEIPGVLINIPRANLLKEPLRIGAKPPPPPLPFQPLSFTNPTDAGQATSTSTYTLTSATSTSTPTAGSIPSNTPTTSQIQTRTQSSAQETSEATGIDAVEPEGGAHESTEAMEATATGPTLAESSQQTPPSSHMDVEPTELSATPGTAEPPNSSPSVSSRKRKAVSDDDEALGIAGDTGQPAGKRRRKSSPQASQSQPASDVPSSPNGSHKSGATTPTIMAHSPLPPPPLTPTISMDSMANNTQNSDNYTQ